MIDYFASNLWQLWALIALVCLILELTNGDFFFLSFTFGAVFGAVAAALGLSGWVQIIIFAVATLISLTLIRPTAKKYLHRGEDKRESNADALVDAEGVITEAIPAGGRGRLQIDGDYWLAETSDGHSVATGTHCRVVSRDSIVLTVAEI